MRALSCGGAPSPKLAISATRDPGVSRVTAGTSIATGQRMPGSFRLLALVVALGGCAFDPPEGSGAVDGSQDPDKPIPPPEEPAARPCGSTEPGLVLCLDFEVKPLGFDSSMYGNNAVSHEVYAAPEKRVPDEQSVVMSTLSRMLITDDSELDLQDYTIEMWIRPDSISGHVALFDNVGHYGMRLDRGDVTCGLGMPVKSDKDDTLPAGVWSHVACRYRGGEMKVYLNGYVSSCKTYAAASTGSILGSAVGGRIVNPTTVDMNFVGGVDNVRVYDGDLEAVDMCTAAGQPAGSCNTKCPDDDDDDDGPGGGGPGGPGN